jgi:hypothetical protein
MSNDYDDGFKWLSNFDTWGTDPDKWMRKAKRCIRKGKSVPEVVALLEKAGFEVFRFDEHRIEKQ